MDEEQSGPPAVVQSLERGLAVIRVFDEHNPELTLSDVARLTGLTRAAARRFLHTLVSVGYMRTDGRRFSLRPRILELGYSYLSSISLPEIAMPHLEELVSRVNESSSVSVLDNEDVIYIARVPVKRIMTVAINVGTRFPAYATSMGRVLLASLPPDQLAAYLEQVDLPRLTSHTITDRDDLAKELARVSRQGWCIVNQELEEGLIAAACPVFAADGSVVGSVNISTHVNRNSSANVRRELLPPLLETADAIRQDLIRPGVAETVRPAHASFPTRGLGKVS